MRRSLSMIDAIANCRGKFGRIVGWVTDSYFAAGFGRALSQYDAITVTAREDMAHPQARHGLAVHHVYQGIERPGLGPVDGARAIDLIGFSHMPPSYHAHFAARFHPASSPHLYLHSPLGNVTGPTGSPWSAACCSSCCTTAALHWPSTSSSSHRASGPGR